MIGAHREMGMRQSDLLWFLFYEQQRVGRM